ncbi:hypothetical protein ACF1BS_04255 [Streptomyces sp. NPDC014748]|uniref:hypothetical protein n=1 Tax=Streptomyces sp. NPDC014748 TaxID=3364905 RepID=UPI0036FBC566
MTRGRRDSTVTAPPTAVETALRDFVARRPLARDALQQDPLHHAEFAACSPPCTRPWTHAEGAPPGVRDRVVHRVLYGTAPDDAEAAARAAGRARVSAEMMHLPIPPFERMIPMTPERVTVRVLLLFGDQAEIVADVPPAERGEPERYPAAEIAGAVGIPVSDLPGQRLTAAVGPGDRLTDWQRA